MARPRPEPDERFEQTVVIAAKPAEVFKCFFAPEALRAWWQATRSVTTPVPLGVYAIEWPVTPFRDELLGSLGGVFHGTIVDIRANEFFVGNAYWIPPEGDALGPMALHIACKPDPAGCKLHVTQEGYEPSPRWRRYYAVVSRGWQVSLVALKRYAETAREGPTAPPGAPVR